MIATIVVPTFNRPEAIKWYLEQFKNFTDDMLVLSIHDSSDNEETNRIIENESLNEAKVRYYRYDSSIDPDSKMFEAIKSVNTDYVWLASDGAVVDQGVFLNEIVHYLNLEYDLIHLDTSDPYKLGVCEYKNPERFFDDCFWSVTGYGSTIVKKSFLMESLSIVEELKELYSKQAAFLWPCLIFHLLANKESKVIHLPCKYYKTNPYKMSSSWLSNGKALEIWVDTLIEDVDALPSLYDPYKDDVCKSVWENTGLNKCRKLLALKSWNCLSIKEVNKRIKNNSLGRVSKSPAKVFMVSLVPIFIAQILNKAYHFMKR